MKTSSQLTPYGAKVREFRQKVGVRLKDMKDSMGRSIALLSAVELGEKNPSPDLVKETIDYFKRKHSLNASELRGLAEISKRSLTVEWDQFDREARQLITCFAQELPKMSATKRKEFKRALNIKDSPKVG